jgi:hypothetical protein
MSGGGNSGPYRGGLPPRGAFDNNNNNNGGNASGAERTFRETIRDLQQLRQSMAQESPELAREMGDLIRQMQSVQPGAGWQGSELDSRIRAQVLPALEQLELMLRRKVEDGESGQVRSGSTERVPAGYRDSVAEYFRRLSKSK